MATCCASVTRVSGEKNRASVDPRYHARPQTRPAYFSTGKKKPPGAQYGQGPARGVEVMIRLNLTQGRQIRQFGPSPRRRKVTGVLGRISPTSLKSPRSCTFLTMDSTFVALRSVGDVRVPTLSLTRYIRTVSGAFEIAASVPTRALRVECGQHLRPYL